MEMAKDGYFVSQTFLIPWVCLMDLFFGKGNFGESLSMVIIADFYLKWKQTVHFGNIKKMEMSVF